MIGTPATRARRGAVLLATDLSPASRPAFRAAVSWARRRQARLDVVHVLTPPSPFGVGDGANVPTWRELEARARRLALRHLAQLGATAARSGVRVRTHLAAGMPAEEVTRVARRQHADVVVIGTHGRTGVRRTFMGSVAERIVRASACPVLTVRAARHGT